MCNIKHVLYIDSIKAIDLMITSTSLSNLNVVTNHEELLRMTILSGQLHSKLCTKYIILILMPLNLTSLQIISSDFI